MGDLTITGRHGYQEDHGLRHTIGEARCRRCGVVTDHDLVAAPLWDHQPGEYWRCLVCGARTKVAAREGAEE